MRINGKYKIQLTAKDAEIFAMNRKVNTNTLRSLRCIPLAFFAVKCIPH